MEQDQLITNIIDHLKELPMKDVEEAVILLKKLKNNGEYKVSKNDLPLLEQALDRLKLLPMKKVENEVTGLKKIISEACTDENWKIKPRRYYVSIGLVFLIISSLFVKAFVVSHFGFPQDSFIINLIRRYFWCLGAACLGFAVLVICFVDKKASLSGVPKSYIFYYPSILIVAAFIPFTSFNSIKATQGIWFYPCSFGLSFLLGVFAERLPEIIQKKLGL